MTSVLSVWEEQSQILPPLSTVNMHFSGACLDLQYRNLDEAKGVFPSHDPPEDLISNRITPANDPL